MFDLFVHVTKALLALLKILRLRKPGRVFLVVRKEDSMLKFVLVLPEPGAVDVVTRRLLVQINGAEPLTYDLASSTLESEELSGDDNDTITGSLVDVDDSNNSSEPRDFEFILTDTIAPPLPGELGLRVTEEV